MDKRYRRTKEKEGVYLTGTGCIQQRGRVCSRECALKLATASSVPLANVRIAVLVEVDGASISSDREGMSAEVTVEILLALLCVNRTANE